ncbi:ribose 5-phosphate isomerase B [Desulfobaculum xiamenense]|uniref:Ribose 5-phosphate isomerase B n=1 Tax=Desulfobaculum xiamenense TaxID=995050 RepID=A0A846QNH4_9BACT|nr:ribose 5-phosphate isomerase B [Desulfobaculum xiamenense]NJB66945.1 ribose 5-phosphate isomerase B [Desulfobaculum xiamenense]
MSQLTVAIGSDHAGFSLKEILRKHLEDRGITVQDVGPFDTCSVDYPVYAKKLCKYVLEEGCPGVLVCGTGIGMSMTANHIPGIRAAVCANSYQARMTRLHNDANVLCLGERVTGPGLAAEILDIFIDTQFEGGRHLRRIELIENND